MKQRMTDLHGIPPIGFGTSLLGRRAYGAIVDALDAGYRHIDTAQTYDSEALIGKALRETGRRREDVFITTKVADKNLADGVFQPSVENSLAALGVDHVDLLLIHWPSHQDAVAMEVYMNALVAAKEEGLTRMVGVSNFPIRWLERAIAITGPGILVNNQVELHPYLQCTKLREWCAANGIAVTAYMPLAKGKVSTDATIARIAERHGTSPAIVTLAWLVQLGNIVIPASSNRAHIEANLGAAGLRLADDEMAEMASLDRGDRMIDPPKAPAWD